MDAVCNQQGTGSTFIRVSGEARRGDGRGPWTAWKRIVPPNAGVRQPKEGGGTPAGDAARARALANQFPGCPPWFPRTTLPAQTAAVTGNRRSANNRRGQVATATVIPVVPADNNAQTNDRGDCQPLAESAVGPLCPHQRRRPPDPAPAKLRGRERSAVAPSHGSGEPFDPARDHHGMPQTGRPAIP